MTKRASEMTIVEEALRAKGWTIESGEYAEIEIDLSRSITDGDFSYVYPGSYYPEIFNDNTYVAYRLDLEDRHAKYYLYDGEQTGSEAPEDDDFDGVADMEVRDVGSMPLARLVEGRDNPQYAYLDLMRADKDWACDLYAVQAGEYFVRLQSNVNVEPRDPSLYYRIEKEAAEQIMELDAADAYSRMDDLVHAMEEAARA